MDKRCKSKIFLSSILLGLPLFSGITFAAQTINLAEQPNYMLSAMTRSASQGMTVQELSRFQDENQTVHVRFQEMYLGVPVYGSDSVLHAKEARLNTSLEQFTAKRSTSDVSMNGRFYQGLATDLSAKPTQANEREVIQVVLDTYKKSLKAAPTIRDIATKLIVYIDDKNVAHWAYRITFNADLMQEGSIPAKPVYIIDAKTSAIYATWDDIKTGGSKQALGGGFGGNVKMGKMSYDGLTDHLPVLDIMRDEATNTCYIQNDFVTVKHQKTGKVMTYACETVDADHNNIYWSGDKDKVNDGYSPSNDALFGGLVIKNMYHDWYGVPVLKGRDGKPMMLNMVVHARMDNAYWDGSQMTFGDGISYFYPLTSLGVAAHEISHGFTEQNSHLEYSAQSGGMNEAFSDMAAQGAEYFAYGKNSWQIGPEIFKAANEALRYMDKPSKDCKGSKPGNWCSIDDASQYKSGLDVHYSSGVYNRLFYLIGTSDGYNVKKAFDLMVKANQAYWTSTSTFSEGACGILSAAKDLSYDTAAIKTALDVVKVKYDKCK